MVVVYVNDQGFVELVCCYVYNLVNVCFLWCNWVGVEVVEVCINYICQGEVVCVWCFDVLVIGLCDFKVDVELDVFVELIVSGFLGSGYVLFEVVVFVCIGDGQEVFFFQELIFDKGDKKGQKSKILYSVCDVVVIYLQKIGNVLCIIDIWYFDEDGFGFIVVEFYGFVMFQGKVYCQFKQKLDFYMLFDNWVLCDEVFVVE